MKMLMFDFRASEREFFGKNTFPGIEIEFIKEPLNSMTKLSEEQLVQTDAVSVYISSDVTEEVIKKFANLRIITTRSKSYSHIDTQYCAQNNIAVFNVENYGEEAASEFTFTLILALTRKLLPAYLDVRQNTISFPKYEGQVLNSLTLGILGCDGIGCKVAKTAKSFGMKVLVCSYEKKPEISSFSDYVSFEKLLSYSDILTLHMPSGVRADYIIGEEAFSKMKDGIRIINISGGALVDIVALYNNLISGKVKGAALDVLECEQIAVNDNPIIFKEEKECLTKALTVQKLLGRDDVIITPHIAYNTCDSVETLLKSTFISICDYNKGLHTNQVV